MTAIRADHSSSRHADQGHRAAQDAESAGRRPQPRPLTVTTATGGEDERTRSVASFRRRIQRLKGHRQTEQKEKIAREVVIPETITIQELANRMASAAWT